MPNIREDIRLLPSLFVSRKLLFIPFLLLVIGLVATRVLPNLNADSSNIAGFFIQFFFLPPALFTFFLAGFLAPRASYLVGFLCGVLAAVFWFIAFVNPADVPDAGSFLATLGSVLASGIVYGTLAAALAAWYRDFLRGMQERGRQRRAQQETLVRAKRKEEVREARRLARQRPSS